MWVSRGRTADRGGAGSTLLGKQVAETIEAVGKVVTGREPLTRQLLLAPSAEETILVPGLVTVGHPTGGDWLKNKEQEVTGCFWGLHCPV